MTEKFDFGWGTLSNERGRFTPPIEGERHRIVGIPGQPDFEGTVTEVEKKADGSFVVYLEPDDTPNIGG